MESRTLLILDKEDLKEMFTLWVNELQESLNKAEKEEEYLTREETAELLKVSLMTLHRWDKIGYLVPSRVGRSVKYKKSAVYELLEKGGQE